MELMVPRVHKAVFPAAGLGTRFLPATKAQPKEMLPLVDKPLIQYGVEEAIQSGISNIIIVTGRGKSAIEDHFDVSFELEHVLEVRGKRDLLEAVRGISEMINVAYVRQKEALGLGHAILTAKNLVDNEPFAVILGDDIISSKTPCLKQLIGVYNKYKCSVLAVNQVPREAVHNYGIVKTRPIEPQVSQVLDLLEKPTLRQAPSNLAIIGRYILTPEIFDALERTQMDKSGELQLTNAIKLLSELQAVYAYEFEGKRYDAGDKLGFLKATVEFALARPDLGGQFREYLKGLNLNSNSEVGSASNE